MNFIYCFYHIRCKNKCKENVIFIIVFIVQLHILSYVLIQFSFKLFVIHYTFIKYSKLHIIHIKI